MPEEKEQPQDAFWQPKSFSELATEQGIDPCEDLDSLGMDWLDDAEFEAFLAAIHEGREMPDAL